MSEIPNRLGKGIRKKILRRSKITSGVVKRVEEVMKAAVEALIDTALFSGKFFDPTLNGIEVAIERFYVEIIHEAFETSKEEKKHYEKPKDQEKAASKRLAKGPVGIPKDLRSLEKIFRDPKKSAALRKRSQKLFQQLRKDYLQKLRKRFEKVVPQMLAGEISPAQAKKEMRQVWGASKSRVETIFRTETTNYFSKVQVSFFDDDDDILGFIYDAQIDISTTGICRSRHGMVYTKAHKGQDSIEYNCPACHYNCRAHFIALANTPENRKLLLDSSRDPSKNRSKIKPLPKGWR